jgi:hypothetical protein
VRKTNSCNLQNAIIAYSTTNLKIESLMSYSYANAHVISKMDLNLNSISNAHVISKMDLNLSTISNALDY